MPRVSVIIPAYNHEKYVGESIQSVLDQTWQDFEIVVTDDGSSDGTVETIRRFKDPRIRLYALARNHGACTALNNSIRHARGHLLAILNSDDAWERTKLESQVAFLDAHAEVGAVFSRVTFVGEDGRLLRPGEYQYSHVFDVENRSRYAWLNRFFYRGNCLCHPSAMVRRGCYREVGLYDERMANIPDLDMWVRLCLKREIHILESRDVRFRIRSSDANTSADRPVTHVRAGFEFKQMLDHYLQITDRETLLAVFPEAVGYGDFADEDVPFCLAMQALGIDHPAGWLWGMEAIYGILGKPSSARKLMRRRAFGHSDFHRLTGQYDVFRIGLALPQGRLLGSAAYETNRFKRLAIRLHWKVAGIVRKFF